MYLLPKLSYIVQTITLFCTYMYIDLMHLLNRTGMIGPLHDHLLKNVFTPELYVLLLLCIFCFLL